MSVRDNVLPDDSFFKFMATSSGAVAMNAAGSSASGLLKFYVTPATSKGSVEIHRVCVDMLTSDFFPSDTFAAATSALANGILIQVQTSSGGLLHDYLDGSAITANNEWAWLAGNDVTSDPASSAGAAHAKPVRWTLQKAGAPLLLGIGARLVFALQDDMSSSGMLLDMRAMAQGVYTK